MPRTITLSVLPVGEPDTIRALLDRFEAQTGIHVNTHWVNWENYRRDTVNIALKRHHVDVSMVGMPVTSDLEGMNVLRPFSAQEIASMGGAGAFLPARWQSGIRPDSPQVWAIPWCLDVRVLAYWRDMLDQAGIAEEGAFASSERIEAALRQLQECGHDFPFYIPTFFQLLHAASSWIWEQGGDLFAPGGRRAIFHEAEALRGLTAFFRLARYSSPEAHANDQSNLFLERKVAVAVSTPVILQAEQDPRLGAVALPGGSYVGGVDLVIWAQTVDEQASLELVRFLTQPGLLVRPHPYSTYLSPRLAELTNPANWTTALGRALANAALHGRAYPCVAMVGLVEERLSMTLEQVLKDLYTNPDAPVEETVRARMEPLAKRINLALSQE